MSSNNPPASSPELADIIEFVFSLCQRTQNGIGDVQSLYLDLCFLFRELILFSESQHGTTEKGS